MARRNATRSQKKLKWFVLLILLIVLTIYGAVFAEKIVKPNMAAIAEVRVKAIITQIVNDAVHEQFATSVNVGELLAVKTDNEGNITMVESNTLLMNRLATELTGKVQTELKTMEAKKVKVPLGSILGNQILSQIGPYIELKVLPIGMSRMNFKTEFESTGINQTKYKVFLEMESQARVLAPFSINNIN